MDNFYLAKTNPVETIAEHTDNLLEQYDLLKSIYGNCGSPYINWEILWLACLYHDLGKMNVKFQNKLRKILGLSPIAEGDLADSSEISHNYLSPAFIPEEAYEKLSPLEQKILFQSIYRHHKRFNEDFESVKLYISKLKVCEEKFGFAGSKFLKELKINSLPNSKYKKFVRDYITEHIDDPEERRKAWYYYSVIKGLLNKIDYAASTIVGTTPIPIEIAPVDLTEKTGQFMKKSGFSLNELQTYLAERQNENNIVVAATGFGKTEAGLMWIGKNKGFFTLPLKVSINAIYDRLIRRMALEKEKVGLLHSDTFSEYIKRTVKDDNEQIEFDDRYLKATRQLSLPLTICTLDQLIDFVFKYDGCELKLATLAYSKIVIDEIQMYAPSYLAAVIAALKYLTAVGGKFTIMTATFPPVLLDIMKQHNIPVTFCEKEFYQDTLRHRVEVFEEVINFKHLKENFADNKKYLIICNTVKKAQEIYASLKNDGFFKGNTQINLLHSRFIKKHRGQKEDAILAMGKKENKRDFGIWITTQIVEASLDIDFDFLYTELSEVNSLFQRMGRVYRSRVLDILTPNVFVYAGDENNLPSLVSTNNTVYYAIDYNIFKTSKQALLKNKAGGISEYSEKLKMDMVRSIYCAENLKQNKSIYGKNYYDQLHETLRYLDKLMHYRDENETLKLRDIEQTECIPLEVYEKGKNDIDHLAAELKELFRQEKELKSKKREAYRNCLEKNKIPKQKLMDKLNEYKLPVWTNIFEQNRYEPIIINDYLKIEIGNFCYSKEMGLTYKKFKENVRKV